MTSYERKREVFERISDAPFTSDGIRPGGLELTRRAVGLAKWSAGDTVLDIGCGTGVTVGHLIREHLMRAVGIDSSSMLPAKGKAVDVDLPLLMGDAGLLPFPEGSFDGVIMECTLSLVRDREAVLNECRRVLRPNGAFVVTDLYARNPEAIQALKGLDQRSCVQGAHDKRQFTRECSTAGFGLKCFEDHSRLLRDFAARIIWTYGSLDGFWTETCGERCDLGRLNQAVREAQPGYFLYVGRKV
ncbi:MAG: class I SAM-dependent methyltransferase [Pseudomonadota bacterium]